MENKGRESKIQRVDWLVLINNTRPDREGSELNWRWGVDEGEVGKVQYM